MLVFVGFFIRVIFSVISFALFTCVFLCYFIATWWRHQMETFSALLAICAGNYSPHKGQWRGALMFTLICARINGRVNNREAGDLRRNRAHYDVIVVICHCVRASENRPRRKQNTTKYNGKHVLNYSYILNMYICCPSSGYREWKNSKRRDWFIIFTCKLRKYTCKCIHKYMYC